MSNNELEHLEKIYDKLQKLMKLKESASELGNVGEANAAAAAISRLLLAYNLSESDIPESQRDKQKIIIKEHPCKSTLSSGAWYGNLIATVCRFNFCKSLIRKTRKDNGRLSTECFLLVGREHNVKVAIYLVEFLSDAFYRFGENAYPDYRRVSIRNGITPQSQIVFMRNFLLGCIAGLEDQLKAEQEETESKEKITALVRVASGEIDDFLAKMDITKGRQRKISADRRILNIGYDVGRNIDIHKAVEGKQKEHLTIE